MKQYDIITNEDWLDLLFRQRNKSYGAYPLRKYYGNRLLAALGAGLAFTAGLLLLIQHETDKPVLQTTVPKQEILIREYKLPLQEIKPPVKTEQSTAKATIKKTVKTARVKYVNRFEIKKDELVKTNSTAVAALQDKEPGTEDQSGIPATGLPGTKETGIHQTETTEGIETEKTGHFVAHEIAPEFPGGANALHRFLSANLRSPDDLETGDKKLVKVKFTVDAQGFVSAFEIMETAGPDFDREVLRVCKKMPRWKPAEQNGTPVPVSFMIPVTFVGPE